MDLKNIRSEYLSLFEGKTIVPQEKLLIWHADFMVAIADALQNEGPYRHLAEIGLFLPTDYNLQSIDMLFSELHENLRRLRHAAFLKKAGHSALIRLGNELNALKAALVDFENHLHDCDECTLLATWDKLVLDTSQSERAACNSLRATFIHARPGMFPLDDVNEVKPFLHRWIDDASNHMNILNLPSPLELARIVGDLASYGLSNGLLALMDEQPVGIEIPAFIESIIGGFLYDVEYAEAFTLTSLDQVRKRLDAAESLIVDMIHGEKATLPRWDYGPFEGILELFTGNSKQALPERANRDDLPIPTAFSLDALACIGPMMALAVQKLQAAPELDESQWQAGREALSPFMRLVLDVLLELANDDHKDSYGMNTIGRIRWLFSLCRDELTVVGSILEQWSILYNEPMIRNLNLIDKAAILARFRNVALNACSYIPPDSMTREFVRHIAQDAVQPYETMIKFLAVVRRALAASAALRQVPLPEDGESVAGFRLLSNVLTQPGQMHANSVSVNFTPS